MTKLRNKTAFTILAFSLILAMRPGYADGKTELADAELDAVVAGGSSTSDSDETSVIDRTKITRAGTEIGVDGTFRLLDAADYSSLGSLIISDSAQSNLSSLININAVNSAVNVLLNLNISIDSNIDTINQSNLQGLLRTPVPVKPPKKN